MHLCIAVLPELYQGTPRFTAGKFFFPLHQMPCSTRNNQSAEIEFKLMLSLLLPATEVSQRRRSQGPCQAVHAVRSDRRAPCMSLNASA